MPHRPLPRTAAVHSSRALPPASLTALQSQQPYQQALVRMPGPSISQVHHSQQLMSAGIYSTGMLAPLPTASTNHSSLLLTELQALLCHKPQELVLAPAPGTGMLVLKAIHFKQLKEVQAVPYSVFGSASY